MTTQTTPRSANPWADDDLMTTLCLRMKTYWNRDYFERIVLPLLDLPRGGCVLNVGCGNGGISLLLADFRGDLQITGVDRAIKSLEDAAAFAARSGFTDLHFAQGDAHQMCFDDGAFDGVLCQTVLTHVRDAWVVVGEMARVLKSGGVFFAAEFTNSGAIANYDNIHTEARDEAWYREYYRISQLYTKGKQALGRGDNTMGVLVPLLATEAGLDVYDVRLNDRVAHSFPPYRHQKQRDYLEMTKAYYSKVCYASDVDDKLLRNTIKTIQAGGGTEENGHWFHAATDHAGAVRAIEEGRFTQINSIKLYLTFARKP